MGDRCYYSSEITLTRRASETPGKKIPWWHCPYPLQMWKAGDSSKRYIFIMERTGKQKPVDADFLVFFHFVIHCYYDELLLRTYTLNKQWVTPAVDQQAGSFPAFTLEARPKTPKNTTLFHFPPPNLPSGQGHELTKTLHSGLCPFRIPCSELSQCFLEWE